MYEIKNRANKQQREKISNLMNGYKFKRKKQLKNQSQLLTVIVYNV